MKSYKEHLQSIKSIGEEVSNTRRPVYRGSAVFAVVNNQDLKTRILFMGYWMVKNSIEELGLLVTLRAQSGEVLLREKSQIDSPDAREVDVQALLDQLGLGDFDFRGSIELEIFSCRDLVFPYPAFVINYYNALCSTAVHTTGRIYNDYEDLINNEQMKVKECGFDLFPGEDKDPFFSFVNGYEANKECTIDVDVITESGRSFSEKLSLGTLKPLETVFVKFKEHIPLDSILGGEVGTVKIKHNFEGFFPRFIAGNFSKKSKGVSITHTYYDNSDNNTGSAYWTNENEELLYDSAIYVPLLIEDDWYTQVKLYPIYSPSNHSMTVRFHNMDGEQIAEVENYKYVNDDHNDFISIDFSELAESLGLSKSDVKGAYLIKHWNDKNRIPSRLKYGLNIGRRNKEFDLPTNICFGSEVSNIRLLKKKGAFKWMPLLNHGDSLAIIENSSFVKNYNTPANLELNFYSKSGKALTRKAQLQAHSQMRITVDGELKELFEDKSGWLTVKSDNPFVKAWYFEFNESGIMGGDHSF